MRLVVQRVARASVESDGEALGQIGQGSVVLVGVAPGDTPDLARRMANKLIGLRYFADTAGRTNLSLAEADGALLVVSQFTLYADVRRGRRPGFTDAADPTHGAAIVDAFVASLRALGVRVATGRFGARMAVSLVNDGPFTLLLDSDRDLAPP
jgi:D-tyrosyl-tRNA(Tyr) deacylase